MSFFTFPQNSGYFGLSIHLDVPFSQILKTFLNFDFEPMRCREALSQMIKARKLKESNFNLDAFTTGGHLVTNEVLFPSSNWCFSLGVNLGQGIKSINYSIVEDQVQMISTLFRSPGENPDYKSLAKRFRPFIANDEMFDAFTRASNPTQFWPSSKKAGIYRREHASVAFSSGTTKVLVDPIGLRKEMFGKYTVPVDETPNWDGILITHSHGDHWHLPSLMNQLPSPLIPVVVPYVPNVNLLTTEDFRKSLEAVGQCAQSLPWGTTLSIGDIEVDILPFYGEQPTPGPPGPSSNLRNWGNCYRINTAQYSALVLVDSGADSLGDMRDVVRASVEKRGPVDFVLSCLREFSCPFFGGLTHYWASLPFSRLRELFEDYKHGKLGLSTAGPAKIAEICKISSAKYFLPYANGYEGAGQCISDIGWGQGEESEHAALSRLQKCLSEIGGTTRVLQWNPGDGVQLSTGQITKQIFNTINSI